MGGFSFSNRERGSATALHKSVHLEVMCQAARFLQLLLFCLLLCAHFPLFLSLGQEHTLQDPGSVQSSSTVEVHPHSSEESREAPHIPDVHTFLFPLTLSASIETTLESGVQLLLLGVSIWLSQ